MHKEPSGRIFRHALQFFELAKPAFDDPLLLERNVSAIVCNLALSTELLLKSCDAGVKIIPSSTDSLITDSEIYSQVRGHDLTQIFDHLDGDIRSKLEALYRAETTHELKSTLVKYKDYFVHARYAYEPASGHVYDVSGIKYLAENLIAAIGKWNY